MRIHGSNSTDRIAGARAPDPAWEGGARLPVRLERTPSFSVAGSSRAPSAVTARLGATEEEGRVSRTRSKHRRGWFVSIASMAGLIAPALGHAQPPEPLDPSKPPPEAAPLPPPSDPPPQPAP